MEDVVSQNSLQGVMAPQAIMKPIGCQKKALYSTKKGLLSFCATQKSI